MLAYALAEFHYLETLAKIFAIPARQNHFNQGNNFNSVPDPRFAVVLNTNSAFAGFYMEKSLCFNLLISNELKISQKTTNRNF